MSKYHDYSVRSMLESYFGKEPLQEMRAEHERWQDASDTAGLIPHAWEQADEKVLFLCQSEYFLLDTRLCDDYIAYIVQYKRGKTAILAFLHFTDKSFDLDPQYAVELTRQWEQLGHDVLIACIHIEIRHINGVDGKQLIEYEPRAARAGAVDLLRAKNIRGKCILVREEPLPCWVAIKRNFVSAVRLNSVDEYRCLFSEDITVFEGEEKDRKELTSGIANNLEAGMWGYINEEGKIVVEPQYTYVASFYIGDGAFAIVAKRTEEGLRWGAIDTNGREIIPCLYRNLYSRSGDVLIYQTCDNELYGLLDLNGNTIMEPEFRYIGDYDEKHGLVACGNYEEEAGVYSIRQDKMIVPPKYDCITFEDSFISAEIALTGLEDYFDYEGNELNFGDYDSVYEPYQMPGHLVAWKDGKCALLKMDGAIIVPFTENNGSNFEYYDQGFLVTGSRQRLGLCRVSGEMILPERFSKITVSDGFIIASHQAQHAVSVSDELYTFDGKLVLRGAYRNISINDNTMKAETPNGIEYYSIYRTSPDVK